MPEPGGPRLRDGLGLTWVIALREFTTRIRTRSFGITTGLLVAGLGGYILLQAYVFNNQPTTLDVGFATEAQSLAPQVQSVEAGLGVTMNVTLLPSLAAGKAQVQDGTLDAAIGGPASATTVLVKSSIDASFEDVLNNVVRESVLRDLLTQRGVDPAPVLGQISSTSVNVDELSPINAARVEEIVIGILVALTLYVTLQVYGQLVAAGVVEEKSNRIVEILLTAVRPWQLMLGKVIGIGLVSVLQLAAAAVVALVLASITKLVSLPTLGFDVVVGGIVWFVLGYLLYALVFAGAASMVSRQEDVASVTMPVILLAAVAWILALTVAAPDPGSSATTILSMIPPFSPTIMPVRIAAGDVPAWQYALSILLSVTTIYVFALLAGRIYRNSVLRVGSRVKLSDALGLPSSGGPGR
jgi:ABC-2 type transport system permease protein